MYLSILNRFWRPTLVAAMLMTATLAPLPAGAAPASGSDIVRSFYDTLLATMKNGRTLGESGRYAQLKPVIEHTFDLPLMARLAVGPVWANLSEPQRAQFIRAFGRYISAIYADRFDSYSGERLVVGDEKPTASGIIVQSRIIKSDGKPVNIDYLMRQNGGSWQISDVYLDGTISELATRRSEFAGILRSGGIDALIAALNRKTASLTTSPVAAKTS
jgi:phospholipid transport system substrate-binding protein